MNAPSLKILRVKQKQLGNTMVQKLLEGLQTCTKLEQVQCSTVGSTWEPR